MKTDTVNCVTVCGRPGECWERGGCHAPKGLRVNVHERTAKTYCNSFSLGC